MADYEAVHLMLENTWRWFGRNDPITLNHVKQTGATGIVTALHQVPVGDPWRIEDIEKRKREIESEGMRWSVAESLPVHEAIKMRNGRYRLYIDNYKQSIVNLGRAGIDTICYNFMPVLDWSRTDLRVEFKDGSITTKFELKALAAFDLYQLKRSGAEHNYSSDQINEARLFYDSLSESAKDALIRTVLLGLPGSGDAYSLDEFRRALSNASGVREPELRDHLHEFLKEVIPVAEESGVNLAIHPDDPPRSLFGLPRIVSTEDDLAQLLAVVDSRANGLTFCAGSLGAGTTNDVVSMARRFPNRITFIHLRNVTKTSGNSFVEDNHLEGDVDMYEVMKALVIEQLRRVKEARKDSRMPLRPDHGHFMLADERFDKVYPGYSLFGRMRGLAELRGLEMGVRRSLGL